MPVTIYEIAEKAGVSTSTVSRVLRGTLKENWKSSSERAKRVRRVAEELGYRPNLVARAFSEQKTMGIGLISEQNSQVFEPTNREIVLSISETLASHGYHMVIVSFDDTSHWQDILLGRRLDGCFLLNYTNPEITRVLKDSGLPAVQIGERSKSPFPQVESDDFGGGYKAGRHLLGLGHRHLAYYVNEQIRPHYSIEERQRGLESAIAEFGAGAELKTHIHSTEQEFINSLISPGSKTTGVLAYCDLEAIALTHALPKHGIYIPRDVSLIGFNNVYPTNLISPPLTVVGFDTKEIGEAAARSMLNQITPKEPQSVNATEKTIVEQSIIVRESTGPSPDRHPQIHKEPN